MLNIEKIEADYNTKFPLYNDLCKEIINQIESNKVSDKEPTLNYFDKLHLSPIRGRKSSFLYKMEFFNLPFLDLSFFW